MRASRAPRLSFAVSFAIAGLLAAAPPTWSQQAGAPATAGASNGKVLTLADYPGWKRIQSAALSPNGRWVTWAVRPNDGDEVALDDHPILVNPGSVGQPRDGNPDASYLLLDLEAGRAEFRRVAYDIGLTQRLMREVSLPRWLIERLSLGR